MHGIRGDPQPRRKCFGFDFDVGWVGWGARVRVRGVLVVGEYE